MTSYLALSRRATYSRMSKLSSASRILALFSFPLCVSYVHSRVRPRSAFTTEKWVICESTFLERRLVCLSEERTAKEAEVRDRGEEGISGDPVAGDVA
jgi:hypothetical protein